MSFIDSKRRSLWLTVSLSLLGVTLLGVALSLAPVVSTAAGFLGHGHGHGGRGFLGRHGHGHGGGFDAERLRFGVSWVLRGVDASDEQLDAIAAIAEKAHADLHPLKESHHQTRAAFVEAFTAEEIDAEALEVLRLDTLSLADEASRRLFAALSEAASVLTPAQRRELAERHQRFHREYPSEDPTQ